MSRLKIPSSPREVRFFRGLLDCSPRVTVVDAHDAIVETHNCGASAHKFLKRKRQKPRPSFSAKSNQSQVAAAAPMSSGRRWAFRVGALLVPLFVLALLEI